MDKKKYIKVTPKGSDKSHVVLATNEAFYKSQGAKIDEPTAAEIVKYFPEEGKSSEFRVPSSELIAALETAKTAAETKVSELETALETAKTAAETAKADYEAKIQKLDAEIAKLKKV